MKTILRLSGLGVALAALLTFFGPSPLHAPAALAGVPRPQCDDNGPLCTETWQSIGYNGGYTGHDEPSVLFYSSQAGSGNNNVYNLALPKDPPTLPKQDGTGGTFNFQLHPAFWFGMAMCDDQSAPNPGPTDVACKPNSDANIYEDTSTTSSHYVGLHPGGAYMEMQFYPPGWVPWPLGNSCDATKWCAALNIDSLSENMNTGVANNKACLNIAGIEPVNFAFITKNGVAQAPASPLLATSATYTPDANKDLFMNSGDQLVVSMKDTSNGFQVVIKDLTTGQSGSMTASTANQFAQVKYDPTASTCTNIPHAFHPMFSTSSEKTRLTWTAHSYNVAFSDEIGHFEFCNAVNPNLKCTQTGINDQSSGFDADDYYCLPASMSTRIQVTGCLATEDDFDGSSYGPNWPGSISNATTDASLNPTSILFSSPRFNGVIKYSRIAFEADLPRIEDPSVSSNNNCNRSTGAGCVNPPNGAAFYPFYSTRNSNQNCMWQLGGAYIPGTTNLFGGNSAAEFGPLLQLYYPVPGGVSYRYNDFRQILSSNPC